VAAKRQRGKGVTKSDATVSPSRRGAHPALTFPGRAKEPASIHTSFTNQQSTMLPEKRTFATLSQVWRSLKGGGPPGLVVVGHGCAELQSGVGATCLSFDAADEGTRPLAFRPLLANLAIPPGTIA